jgi:hypothetical protein
MSQDTIHIVITVGIIAVMFAWVPFLNIICPPGWKSDEKPSKEKKPKETRQERTSVASLTSRRLAEQSRDFLHALSTRGERESAGSPADASRVPPGSCAE